MPEHHVAQQGTDEVPIELNAEYNAEVAQDQAQMHPRERTKEATRANLTMTTPPTSNDNDIVTLQEFVNKQNSSDDVGSKTNHAEACVTTTPPDSSNTEHEHAVNETTTKRDQVLPSGSSIVRPGLLSPLPRDTTPPPTPPSNINTAKIAKLEPALHDPLSRPFSINTTKGTSSLHSTRDRAAGQTTHEGKMVFGHGANRPGLSQRRRNFANTNALTDQEADLTSKDRATQREAVAKFLAENVHEDWNWEWPQPADVPKTPTSPTLLRSPTSDLSQEITVEWKERDEWSDNASEGAEDSPSSKIVSPVKEGAFKFESPDGVGDTIKKIETDRKRRRKKRIADEMAWNDGLHCFIERRDAWTGARRVSRSPRVGMTPIRKHHRSTSLSSKDDGSSTAIEQEEDSEWDDEIEIPIAPPFLPPENSLRASIGPHAYPTIYDKVILNQLTPLCPINLKDITRSCVKGWQRDGEWPPKPTELPRGSNRRKLSVAGLFGFDKSESPKDKEMAEGAGVQKDGEKREDSPVSSISSKLGKILHLKKK